jgi:hypothetical protein
MRTFNETPEECAERMAKMRALRGPRDGVRRREMLRRRKERIIELRDEGKSISEIAHELKIRTRDVKAVIYDGVIRATRIQNFNEALVSRNQKGIAIIDYWLDKNDKMVAMWLLEKTGTVGKEQVNLTINAGTTNITLNNDTIEAARMVAEAMRAARPALPPAPPAEEVIEAEVIEQTEENSDEHTGVNVGIASDSNENEGRNDTVGGGDTPPLS